MFLCKFCNFFLRKIIHSFRKKIKKKKMLQYICYSSTTWDSTQCTVHPTVSYNNMMRATVHATVKTAF